MKKDGIKIIIALILFFIALIVDFGNIWINNILYILAYAMVGIEIVIKAFKNIIKAKYLTKIF